MKEEKLLRKKNVKGSVLFTVVAVMMVMIVFVMATLTIAGAANKRAYASYSKNQTTYTARSAIESVYTAMSDATKPDLANAVKSLSNGSTLSIGVTLPVEPDGSSPMGTIKNNTITVECLPASQQYEQTVFDPITGTISKVKRDVVKITAIAQLGDEESTVSAYYLKDPIKSTGSIFKNALTTMGSANTGTSGKAYGGANIGITASKWIDKLMGQYDTMSLSNNGVMTADFISNKSISCSGGGSFQFTKAGQGMVILGDFNQMKDNGKFKSIIDVTSTSINYNDLPYVYVEGDFNLYQDGNFGTNKEPINIYSGGSINVNGTLKLYSDIYIYDHDFSKDVSDSDITPQEEVYNTLNSTSNFWTGSNPGGLLEWVDTLVTKNNDNPSVGSNIFSKGSVSIGQDSRSPYKLEGDVIVEKNLTLNGGVEVSGSIVCKETLTILHGNKDKIVSGGIFCDPDKLVCEPNVKINGVTRSSCSSNADFIQKVNAAAISNNGNSILVASSGFTYTLDTTSDATYNTSLKNMILADTNGTGVNGAGETVYFFPASKGLREVLGYGDANNKIVNTASDAQNEYVSSNGYYKIGYLDVDELSSAEISDIQSSDDTKNTLLNEPSCNETVINFGNGKITSIQKTEYTVGADGSTLIPNVNTYWDGSPEVNAYYRTVNLNGVDKNVVYIDSSCTIEGTIQFGQIVYVDPSANSNLWIKVGNLSFTNPNTFNGIIVNNSNPNNKANFYIKRNSSVNLDGSYILTKSYYEKYYNSSALEVKENPTDTSYISNIYIYSGHGDPYDFGGDKGTYPKLSIINNSMVTAYVVAPYLYIVENNATSTGKFAGVSYEDETGISGQLTILGSAIVGEAKIDNEAIVMFIDPSGASGGGGGGGASGDWALLYYQNS